MKSIIFIFFLIIATQGTLQSAYANENQEIAPCTIVIFGATGDLTARKLVPAIYNLACDGYLSPHTAVVGFARAQHTHETFRKQMSNAIDQFSRKRTEETSFKSDFANKMFYHKSDFEQSQGYEDLKGLLSNIDDALDTEGNRIYYLATSPSYFYPIIRKLHEHGLIYDSNDKKWSKVIIEKPFGKDITSAVSLHKEISEYLDQDQIYLMDHYLGKEGVQNLLTLRFENALLEPLWNNKYIDNIQITLAEEIGIGTRANFWEETGTLRDVFQNHLMQLLAMIAMEQPVSLDTFHIHEEKIKLLKAIRPFPLNEMENYVIRGQYSAGLIKGMSVPGYKQENGVLQSSSAETFVAAKIFIDNPRWAGVPFYIRGGKRLSKQTTEVVVTFKNSNLSSQAASNVLFIRIQPNTAMFLKLVSKIPMLDKRTAPVLFGYSLDAFFKTSSPEAYEKLFYDCVTGDHSLFVTAEEQFAAWELLTPVINYWKTRSEGIEGYDAGTWGPSRADELLKEQRHQWHLLENENL